MMNAFGGRIILLIKSNYALHLLDSLLKIYNYYLYNLKISQNRFDY